MTSIEWILHITDISGNLFEYARDYMFIIFIGIPFLAIYNVYAAVLRGIGNSTVPFIAVIISSAINGVLDVLLVAICKYGVAGAAIATVLSQIAMSIFMIAYTSIKYPSLRFNPFKLDWSVVSFKTDYTYGAPPALHAGVSSAGNIFLQRFMNSFGKHTVAAITTAYRVDSVMFLPIINFCTAISTMVSQNIGSGNEKDAKKICKLGILIMTVLSLLLTGAILLVGKILLQIFGLSQMSIEIGKNFFSSIAKFYVIYGIATAIKGYLEGIGDMLFSAIIGIMSLGVRILCSYMFKGIWGNMVVAYAEAISWLFMLTAFLIRFKKSCLKYKV